MENKSTIWKVVYVHWAAFVVALIVLFATLFLSCSTTYLQKPTKQELEPIVKMETSLEGKRYLVVTNRSTKKIIVNVYCDGESDGKSEIRGIIVQVHQRSSFFMKDKTTVCFLDKWSLINE